MIRILAIDYGDARVGFATCDKDEIIATGLRTEKVRGMRGAAEISAKIAEEEGAEMIVVGLPLNMDGTRGFRVENTLAFCEILKTLTPLPIETCDERCTTVSAYNFMLATNTKKTKKRSIVDTISAEIILQTFIDKRKNK
ncbi:MAG: Holliday junction resolvase RuvX [Ruminococcaceae bacterium]|nr:Holliday junction resolvase RuvX [Oscillospiraceae bacterium]